MKENNVQTAGFTAQDEYWLHRAGEALTGQTKESVEKWRAAIAAIAAIIILSIFSAS